MYVKGPDNALLNLQTAPSAKLRAGWQTGQLLKAMVLSTDRQGGAMLEINGQRLQALPQNQSGALLRAGQSLQLEVMRTGDSPVLKVLNPPATQQEVISRGVRQALPQQQPLPQLLNALNQLAQSGKGELGQQLKSLSQQILNQLPQLQQLKTGPAIKQAIQDSGNFLESRLRQLAQEPGKPVGNEAGQLNRDLKAGVLRLIQLLRSMPQSQTAARGQPAAQTAPPPSQAQAPVPQAQAQAAQNAASSGARGAAPTPAQATASPPAPAPAPAAPQTAAATTATAAQQVAQQGGEPTGKAAAYSQNQPPTPPPPQSQPGQTSPVQAAALSMLAARGGDTQQQLESGLARIQFNQLQSIQQADGQQRPSWLLELPIRQPDGHLSTLELEIQREREEDGKRQKPAIWSISLSFELQNLGQIRAGLTLVGDNQVGVSLWADEEDTVALFEQHLETLQQGMEEAGLQVSRVGCAQGVPRKDKAERVFAHQGLVDEQA